MGETLTTLIEYCRERDRVCPLPLLWKDLWELLPDRRQKGGGWEPPLPLILGAWHYTSNLDKMIRLDEHLRWAAEHECLSEAAVFLRGLAESDWHHLTD